MKLTKFMAFLSASLLFITFTSCCKDDKNEPGIVDESRPIDEAIVGNWLLASSTAEEWTVYEFTKGGLVSSEWFVNNSLLTGSGTYFTNKGNATLTGTIFDDRGKQIRLDWEMTSSQIFQVDLKIFGGQDGNQLIGTTSLYKILGSQEYTTGTNLIPDYRGYTGTKDCSNFLSLDEDIITANVSSGEIECINEGQTFITFDTPVGKAVLKITVVQSDEPLPLAENILGTWVTDYTTNGWTWERDTFGPDGYYYAQWSREVIHPTSNESAQGTYTTDEAKKIIYVQAETPYHKKLTAEYRITQIDRYSFNTDIYSGGDKTQSFYYQKVLTTVSIDPTFTSQPDYQSLVGRSRISGYNSHDTKVATVNPTTGLITAISPGITYIDVITNQGTAVVEVEVVTKAIP